jgi:sRNA-binding regulator protein Hfq
MMGSNKSRSSAGFSESTQALLKGLVFLLAVALASTNTTSTFAKQSQASDPSTVASQVKKFGVGKAVKVKLTGGEKLSGHIQSIGVDTFTVKLSKRGGERTIPYAQVVEVKDPGPLTWMLIGAAVVILIIIVAHHPSL